MGAIDTGDTAFVLVAAALVMFMTPGLALFYGGMVRSKNVLGTVMQSMVAIGVVSVLWALLGYTLAFGPDVGHVIGSLEWVGLRGVGQAPNADYAATIPALAFMIYQGMFAVITPALITGAFAERMKFSSFLVFTVAVVAPRVQPDRPLGVGSRRLDPGHGGPRLRRRHRGAHQLGRRGPGGGLRRRPAQGLRQGGPCIRTTSP